MKIFKNIKNNKMKRGIALLFVIMLSSILLVIALSISNIATKEAVFSVSARNASDAFYAADTGAECALGNDSSGNSAFNENHTGVVCLGTNEISFANPSATEWEFTLSEMGSSSSSCALIRVTKEQDDINPDSIHTTIISTGYNRTGSNGCGSPSNSIVERELQVDYTTPNPAP